MSFSLTIDSLSALQPRSFVYSYNTEENLKSSPVVYSNQLSYYSHAAFDGIQDVAISKKNALFLTSVKSLTGVFESSLKRTTLGMFAGTVTLQTLDGEDVQDNLGTLIVQNNSSNKSKIAIVPISKNVVELYTTDGVQLVVDERYPYTVRATNAALGPDEQYRKQFVLQYTNNLMSFQTITIEGPRYISYGSDKTLRAVGLMLNNKIINPYLFVPTEITPTQIELGFDPTPNEVRYYNDLESFQNRATVDIKEKNVAETNLLISCVISDIAKSDVVNTNIAMLKTNYTSTGSYTPK
jgi:hypothetical protein